MTTICAGYNDNGRELDVDDPHVVVLVTSDDNFEIDGIKYHNRLSWAGPMITIKSGDLFSSTIYSCNPIHLHQYKDLEDISHLPSPA